jgi:hypothetical protein
VQSFGPQGPYASTGPGLSADIADTSRWALIGSQRPHTGVGSTPLTRLREGLKLGAFLHRCDHREVNLQGRPSVVRLKHPFANRLLEPEIRAVADVALASGTAVLEKIGDFKSLSDPLCRIAFLRAVHAGFIRGQATIIDRILSSDHEIQLGWRDELTLRKIIDAIAWQILDRQLYIARRLCRNRRLVPLRKRSNLQPVVDVANRWQGDDLTRFALISDASTFIDVGDLLLSEPLEGKRLTLAEVKMGDVNREILDIVYSTPNTNEEQVKSFLHRHGRKGFDQLGRVFRQTMRMVHVAEFFNRGESRDPDSSETIKLTEDKVEAETYDRHLYQLLERAKRRGWAVDVVDECLVIGVFRGSTLPSAHKGFDRWLSLAGWNDYFFKCDLVESMVHPLALPLFSRELDSESINDLLFGRAIVLMGLSIEKFIALSNKVGVPMHWSSRKKAAPIPKSKIGIKLDNRVLLAGGRFAVGGGYVLRIFFHGLTPRFMIEVLGRQLTSPDA